VGVLTQIRTERLPNASLALHLNPPPL
jgi:hypothetical protein